MVLVISTMHNGEDLIQLGAGRKEPAQVTRIANKAFHANITASEELRIIFSMGGSELPSFVISKSIFKRPNRDIAIE